MKEMKNSQGNTLVIVIAIIAVLVVGYIAASKFILPGVVNKAVNTAIDSSVNNLNFDNAQSMAVSEQITSVKGILDTETMNKGVINIDGKSPNNQITGNIKYLGQKPSVDYQVKTDSRVEGSFGALIINSSDQEGEERTLHFPTNIETGFVITLGAGKADVDLTDLNTSNINVTTGAGVVDITFPRNTSTAASLVAGAGKLDISVYKGTGIKLIFIQGISNANFGDAYEKVNDNTYQTKNYNDAKVKVDLNIGQAVGGFNIQEIE